MSSIYFPEFPTIQYPFVDNTSYQTTDITLVDITTNVRVLQSALQTVGDYDMYMVVDGDTPQSIAEAFYGSRYYDWIVLITNGIVDMYYDFPMTSQQLTLFAQQKYGITNTNGIHHYENAAGFIVDSTEPLSMPVTNIEYETQRNDEKRNIVLITPALLPAVKRALAAALAS
jgi:hypothetical protein